MPFPVMLLLTGLSVGLPLLNDLFAYMTKAEKTFKGPGRGKKKRKFVVDSLVKSAVAAGAPAAETKKLAKDIGATIDNAVTLANALKHDQDVR